MATTIRDAVLEIASNVPSSKPLAVSPTSAPAGAIEEAKLLPLVGQLRELLSADSLTPEVAAEAAAHKDDFTLARFLIARDLKLAAAATMFRETMEFRATRKVNALRCELHPAAKHAPGSASEVRHAASRAHFFAGFGGVTRDGSPFFLEQMGRFDVYAANRSADVFDLMMDSYITYLETAFASVRLASAKSGCMQRAHSIVDASGVSLSHATNVRVIKAVAKIGTSHYPEIMKKVWIVNVPWAFAAAWNLVAPLLPEQTRKKVGIFGKNYLPQLLQEIDESELPKILGGTKESFVETVPRAEKIPEGLGEQLKAARPQGQMAYAVADEKADAPVAIS